jgi:hypothetical protein
MDLDISSLWSWTLPLWGLVLIILFLGGIATHIPVIQAIGPTEFAQAGGARGKNKRVRFALP